MPATASTPARARTERAPSPRRLLPSVLAAAAVLLAVLAAVVIWFLGGDPPDTVNITSATAQALADEAAEAEPPTAEDTVNDNALGAAGAAADEVWTVDPTIGTFSLTESTGTFVGVRIAEVLSNIGETTAVVRTPDVTGSITLDGTTLTAASFEADFTTLVSDESRREDAIQRALNTSTHPSATFTLAQPVDLDTLPTADAPVTTTATGDLTVNGVTNRVDVPLHVALVDDVAVITGTFDITFADYDVQAPTAPVVLSVEDTGTVELQLFLTRP